MAINDVRWELSDYLNKGEVESVLRFLATVPLNLKMIFDEPSFKTLVNKDEEFGINSDLFFKSLDEAQSILITEIDIIQYRISVEEDYSLPDEPKFSTYSFSLYIKLKEIGFTNNSLKLKSNVLKKLWKIVTSVADKYTNGVIDFANNEIIKALRKFLTYLNSLLGSLSNFIPGVEAVKEIKEVAESYLAMADK